MAGKELLIGIAEAGGAKYSIFEHSVARADWLRSTWKQVQAETAAMAEPAH